MQAQVAPASLFTLSSAKGRHLTKRNPAEGNPHLRTAQLQCTRILLPHRVQNRDLPGQPRESPVQYHRLNVTFAVSKTGEVRTVLKRGAGSPELAVSLRRTALIWRKNEVIGRNASHEGFAIPTGASAKPRHRKIRHRANEKAEPVPPFMFRLKTCPIVCFVQLRRDFNRTMFRLR